MDRPDKGIPEFCEDSIAAAPVPGIQVVETASAADRIEDAASRQGFSVWRISLSGIRSKPELLAAIGKALSFPNYYGQNWDALDECLRDLAESKGWLINFDEADNLLLLPRPDLATLESILSDTARFWSAEGRIFGVLFVGSRPLSEAMALAPAS